MISPKQRSAFSAYIVSLLAGGVLLPQQAGAVDDAELTKQLNNPIAALISVPIKLDWDTGAGEEDADRYTYVVQPVIPFDLNPEWNIISRTIVPVYIDAESPVAGGSNTYGMGDILQSFFFSPKVPTAGGWIWGAGPVLSLPTGGDGLTSDQFSVGPTAILLKQEEGWTYGGLFNHLWSVSGDDDAADVSNTYLQPFLSYTTKSQYTLGINTESSYNWEGEHWTVPVNLTVGKLVKFGKQPVNLQLGYRNYLEAPDGGPDWGLRLQVTLLFPK